MYQGTTPTLILTVGQVDLTGMTVYVTLQSESGKTITKSGADLTVDNNEVAVTLTQQETLSLRPGDCKIQCRWIDSNGNAMASDKATVDISSVLLKTPIKYQGGTGE